MEPTQKELAERTRKRKKAKDELYPFLELSSKSIQDAQNFCQAVVIAIRQAYQQKMKKSTLASLKLEKMLDLKSEDAKRYKFILEMFQDETIFDSIELIEGMQGAIDSFLREENTKRPLKDLKTEFLD